MLSDGLQVHGPDVVAGLADVLPPRVVVTGGLAADGSEFCETVVLSERGLRRTRSSRSGFTGSPAGWARLGLAAGIRSGRTGA